MATMFQGLSYRVLLSTTHFVLVVTSAKTLSGVLITCAALVGSAGGHPGDPGRGGGGADIRTSCSRSGGEGGCGGAEQRV